MRSLRARAAAKALVVALATVCPACTAPRREGAGDREAGRAAARACVAAWPMPNPPSSGLPNPRSYDTTTPGTVQDRVTGLLWQQAVDPGRYDWAAANRYCRSLALAGRHNWRLPSLLELVSIVDLTRADPAVDPDAFPATPPSPFWSAETVVGNSGLAWYVYFKNGGAYAGNDVTDPQAVRCVSGAGASRDDSSCYVVSGATVYDPHTRLRWQRFVDPGSFTASDARGHCAAFDGGGWRVPSLSELMTIVDRTRTDPAIDSAAFPAAPSEFFWSSTPSLAPAETAWGANFSSGAAGASLVTTAARVRCVR